MSNELSPLKALDHIKTYARLDACKRCQYFKNGNCENNIGECIWKDEINIIEKTLKDYEELKKGIAWRKAEYKKEIEFGADCDGIPLSETNKMIISNLYNIMCALESYYKKEVLK